MNDHNGVLMMQRALLAGTLGLAMARKAAAILEGDPDQKAQFPVPESAETEHYPERFGDSPDSADSRAPRNQEGAVLRAILDAANECLGHFDDRPAGERWCDTLFHLLDLAAFAAELGGR
jgi:hypothetical protein